jgi:hypothetical protein
LFIHTNGSTSVPVPSSIPVFKTIKEWKTHPIGRQQNHWNKKTWNGRLKEKKLNDILAFQVDIGVWINSFERSFTNLWGSSSVG